MRKTKIICTIGPATDSEQMLRALMENGMDVARINFSHQTHAEHKKRFDLIKKVRKELNKPIGILLDTKGPEIRVCKFENDKITLNENDIFTLVTDKNVLGNQTKAAITYPNLYKDVNIGSRILIDDGLIDMRVINIEGDSIICKVEHGGAVSNNKGVNVPGVVLSLPYVSSQDRKDIIFGIENDVDFIAASFVRSADDILKIRAILDEYKCNSIRIIAKIENREGVRNIDEIIKVSDGIMVARGDMGVEIPLCEIPAIQKQLIKKAYNAGKQVITATQMLDSMMKNPRPTRAESTDVANAIYDGTSAIMLSGETAAGLYPIEALKTMATIAEWTENDIDYHKRFIVRDSFDERTVTNAISHATCTTAYDLGAKAIITVTKSGQTARMVSKYRPSFPIISCTTDEKVCRHLNLSWGVVPILLEEQTSADELFDSAVNKTQELGIVENGDLVVLTAGVPLGVSGTTNLLKVHIVGDVLVSGVGIGTKVEVGNLCVCQNEEEAIKNFKKGDILVIPETSNNILPILKKAKGIVTEADGKSSHGAVVGMTLDIPVIINANNATKILRSGTTVSIDSGRGLVCVSKTEK